MVFSGGLCSKHNTFTHAAGVRRTQSRNFFHWSISFAETVPTRYRTPASVHGVQNGSPQNIYYYTYRSLSKEAFKKSCNGATFEASLV